MNIDREIPSDLKVKTVGIIVDTGKTVPYEESAQVALDDINKRIDQFKKLLELLKR